MKNRHIYILIMLSISAILFGQTRGIDIVARDITSNDSFDIGTQYAVIIGINDYQKWTPLQNAAQDAKKIKAILEERYYIDEFIELYDKDATASNIRQQF